MIPSMQIYVQSPPLLHADMRMRALEQTNKFPPTMKVHKFFPSLSPYPLPLPFLVTVAQE